MSENNTSMLRIAFFVFILTLLISFIPCISNKISSQKKMLYPPSLLLHFADYPISARALCTQKDTWKPYSGKRLKTTSTYAYLWLEFPPQNTEKQIIHFINKEQNFKTELLKPGRLNGITLYTQGDRTPASKSPFKQSHTVFPLNLSSGTAESYIVEYYDPRGIILEPDFIDPEVWFSSILTQKTLNGFFTGIILALLIYCISLFINTKNYIHLSFALFAISNLFLYAWETRLLLEYIDPFVYPPWLFPVSVASNMGAGLFFIYTLFIQCKNRTTTFLIKFIALLTVLCALASFFIYPLYLGKLITILSISLYFIVLQPLSHAIRHKKTEVIATVIAVFPLLFIKLIDLLTQSISIGQSFFKDYQIILGITTSLIIYSILQKKTDQFASITNTFESKNIPFKNILLTEEFSEEEVFTEFSVGAISLPNTICILEQKDAKNEHPANILHSMGYAPCILSNHLEVIEKAATETIDLLIIDYNSNIEETLNLIRLLRLQYLKRDLPILVITGLISNSLLSETITSGVNDFLIRPFSNSEFISRVKSLLRLKAIALINTDLSRSESEKNAFLYFLTHNVNTPLTLLLNRIQELSKENNSTNFKEIIEDLEVSAGEINDIVQNVLISFRISDNKHKLKIESFNLIECIEIIKPLLLKKSEIKNQKMEWLIPDSIPTTRGDRTALKGVLYNLIDNAIKFTPKHGLIRVQITVLDLLYIEISDSGPGIKEHDITNLFEPFQRLSNKPTGGESSTGLGLYVARELSLMNGATLSYAGKNDTSTDYPGAKFILTLPVLTT